MYEDETFELPHVGIVRTKTVYAHYDGPVLFSCESRSGQSLLAVWVDRSETSDSWLFLPVSNERLQQIEEGRVSLRKAFLLGESDSVWNMISDLESGLTAATLLRSADIPSGYLPAEDSLLSDLWQRPFAEQGPAADIGVIADRMMADVVDLRLSGQAGTSPGVPSATVGLMLSGFQRLVNVVSYKGEGLRGKVPKVIMEKSELRVLCSYPGSLAFRLVSSADPVLVGDTDVGRAVKSVVGLVASKSNKEDLSRAFNEVGPRAMANWKSLTKKIGEQLGHFELVLASPSGDIRGASITRDEAWSTFSLLNEWVDQTTESFEVNGNLVGGDTKSASFHFVADDGTEFRGRLGQGLTESSLTLNLQGTAILQAQYDVVAATSEERIEYSLLEWRVRRRVGGDTDN